eukprot:1165580_1
MAFIEQLVSLIVLLHSVFGGSHDEFLNSDWTFIGTVNRFCTSELLCGGAIPSCDSSTNGKTVQDRIDVNNCVAQGCESGTQWNRNTYYCESSRKEEFLSKGWSYIGNYDRFCTSELDCTGTIPYCDSSTNGKTVQDSISNVSTTTTPHTNTPIIIAIVAVVALCFIAFCYRNYRKHENNSAFIEDQPRASPPVHMEAPQCTQIIVVQPVHEPLITPQKQIGPSTDTAPRGRGEENIRHWMKNTVGFPQYVDNFVLNGYDSFQIVMDIEDTQALVDIGITLKGHQQRIIKQISLLSGKMKQDEGEKEGVATVKASVIRDERTNLLLPQPKTGNCEQRDFRL